MGKITDTSGPNIITDAEGLRLWGETKKFIIGSRLSDREINPNPTYTDTRNRFINYYRGENPNSVLYVNYDKPDLTGYGYGTFTDRQYKSFDSYNKNQRMCGVVTGKNTDGSLQIKVLGQNAPLEESQNYQRGYNITMRKYYQVKEWDILGHPTVFAIWSEIPLQYGFQYSGSGDYGLFGAYEASATNPANRISEADANNFETDGFVNGYGTNFPFYFGKYYDRDFGDIYDNGWPSGESQIVLHTAQDETLDLGVPIENAHYTPYHEENDFYFGGALEDNIDGNLYLLLYDMAKFIAVNNNSLLTYDSFGDEATRQTNPGGCSDVYGTYAGMWKPYNLILTESMEEGRRYVIDGTLPSDAWLYPLDEDDLNATDGEIGPDDTPSGDPNDREDGTPDRNWIDTTPMKPDLPPGAAAQTNYYWMQINELDSFFQWLWNNAGDLADAKDVWQTIQGLYSDLAASILRLRYMPVPLNYLGTATAVTQVNVNVIGHTLNTNKLNCNPPIITLGEVTIPNRNKSNSLKNFFADMSPFTNISLHLPLYGFIDLDTNIFMGQKLRVQACYDAVTGTIQYFIECGYEGEYLTINTVTAKCNVDIPITLQSKADADGAILGNMGRIGQQLANIANPGCAIGATLGLAGVQNEVQAAPMTVRGAVGESGMFYDYPYVYGIIRRPSYSRPSNYAERVGYPCNAQYRLGKIKGYTECFNPYINFKQSEKSDGEYMPRPTEEEIQEIYDALTNGVILPNLKNK